MVDLAIQKELEVMMFPLSSTKSGGADARDRHKLSMGSCLTIVGTWLGR